MKIKVAFVFMTCIYFCFADDDYLGGLRGLPTSEEIDIFFKTSSYARIYNPGVYHVITNLAFNAQNYPSQEVDRVHHCLMTNVVMMPHKVNYRQMCRYGLEEIRSMFSWACSFPFVSNDVNAINYLADYVGTIQVKKPDPKEWSVLVKAARAEDLRRGNPTNLVIFNPYMMGSHGRFKGGPLVKECFDNLRLARSDVLYFTEFRKRIFLDGFPRAIRGFMSHLPESKRPAFRSNIVERARLTPEEQVKVFGK